MSPGALASQALLRAAGRALDAESPKLLDHLGHEVHRAQWEGRPHAPHTWLIVGMVDGRTR